MFLLDSDICSYLLGREYPQVKARFSSVAPELLVTSAVVFTEACYGVQHRGFGLERRRASEDFFESIVILDWTVAAAKEYGKLRAFLTRAGTPIGDHDIMIAAHALAIDATVVTNNTRHYSRVPGLRHENWLS